MSDFKTWEELEEYLSDPNDEWTSVEYWAWSFSKSSMSCGDGCCDDYFNSLEDAINAVKRYTQNRLELVSK